MRDLDPAFQMQAVLLMHSAMFWYATELRNAQGTREFTQTPAVGRAPRSLGGFPVVLSSGMGGLTNNLPSAGQYGIVAGNFRRGYVMRRSSMVRVRFLRELRAEWKQVVVLADTQVDGQPLNDRATAFLRSAT